MLIRTEAETTGGPEPSIRPWRMKQEGFRRGTNALEACRNHWEQLEQLEQLEPPALRHRENTKDHTRKQEWPSGFLLHLLRLVQVKVVGSSVRRAAGGRQLQQHLGGAGTDDGSWRTSSLPLEHLLLDKVDKVDL